MRNPSKKTDKQRTYSLVVIVLLIAIAYIPALLQWSFDLPIPAYFSYQRSLIYMGLFAAWGVSVHHRIIQKQARLHLTAISGLMVFWILVRSIKYFLVTDVVITRYLWYLYYIPMLLIPALSLLVALSLGKPEQYRLPRKWICGVILPTILFLLMVLTNDLHHLVFAFTTEVWAETDFKYHIVYWLLVVWELANAFLTIGILIAKSRTCQGRRIVWQPFVPIFFCMIYSGLYIASAPLVSLIARDITVMFCLCYTATLESCIRCGLIQSNTGYTPLFRAATIGARIVDNNGNAFLHSKGVVPVEQSILLETTTAPVFLPQGIRLSSAPIRGGYIIWQEDVSKLAILLEQLEDAGEFLQGRNIALKEEYDTCSKRRRLAEKNRLYNFMQAQTECRLHLLSNLLDSFEENDNKHNEKHLLTQIAVLTVYLKRRNNLFFLSENHDIIPAEELYHCFKESMQNLEMFGILCDGRFDIDKPLSFAEMISLYDTFEHILERSLDSLTSLFLFAGDEDGPVITLRLTSKADLSGLASDTLTAESEDEGEWRLVFRLHEGGVAV